MFEKAPRRIGAVVSVPIAAIAPSPNQTRADEDPALPALARSIESCGLINPVTLRRTAQGFEMLAGHRRLAACRLLGMAEIPAIILEKDELSAGALTIIENLHRRELGCFEEAEGIRRLMQSCGMSQIKVCRVLALSQPALSNKLRLLRLPEPVRRAAAEAGLGERACRALLRLPGEEAQLSALARILSGGLNAQQTEALVERLCAAGDLPAPERPDAPRGILRDYRLLFSTVDRAVEEIRRSGIEVTARRSIEDAFICYTIRIPKTPARPSREPQISFSELREAL